MNAAAPHRLATNTPGKTAKGYAYKIDSTRDNRSNKDKLEKTTTRANGQQNNRSKERDTVHAQPKGGNPLLGAVGKYVGW